MQTKLEWIKFAISLLVGYLFQSACDGKLALIGGIFAPNINKEILGHSISILIVLGLIYVVVQIVIGRRVKSKVQKTQCYNVCKEIYERIDSRISTKKSHTCRVTIFKAIMPKYGRQFLRPMSRYQTKAPYEETKLKFNVGEGCAGKCFESQMPVTQSICDYNPKKPELYYIQSKECFNLDEKTVKKLHVKASSFLGIPIKYYSSKKTWGVLLIDSTLTDLEFGKFARELESLIDQYSVFFTEEAA